MAKTLLIIEKNPSGSRGLKKAREKGLKLIVMSSNKYYNKITEEDKKYIDKIIEIDTNNNEQVVNAVMELNNTVKLDGVITFMEFYVPLAALIAEKLNLPGLSLESAYNARNKFLMRQQLEKENVPIPLFRGVRTINEAKEFALKLGFPNIIKPTNLAGSRSVLKNNTMEELEANFHIVKETIPPFGVKREEVILLEEYMDGPEFSVEAVSFNGDVCIAAVTKKLVAGKDTFVEVGHVIPAGIDPEMDKDIRDTAKRAILGLGIYTGVSHTEIKYTNKGPKIVEVAARLGGDNIPELVELSSGVDLWEASIAMGLGEEPQITPRLARSAAIAYLTAPEGVVEKIEDENSADKTGVCKVCIQVKLGDRVRPLKNSSDRLGYVIATGSNPEEAENNSLNGVKSIKITIQDDKS